MVGAEASSTRKWVRSTDSAALWRTECDQAVQRRSIRAQRWRAEQEGLLTGSLVFIEQHHHQAGTAAEAAKQGAFADASGRGNVVHGDCVRTASGDQAARRLQQECTIACRVAPLWYGLLPREHRQVTQPLGAAHLCTVTRSE